MISFSKRVTLAALERDTAVAAAVSRLLEEEGALTSNLHFSLLLLLLLSYIPSRARLYIRYVAARVQLYAESE